MGWCDRFDGNSLTVQMILAESDMILAVSDIDDTALPTKLNFFLVLVVFAAIFNASVSP